jgi:hypothetical protein
MRKVVSIGSSLRGGSNRTRYVTPARNGKRGRKRTVSSRISELPSTGGAVPSSAADVTT